MSLPHFMGEETKARETRLYTTASGEPECEPVLPLPTTLSEAFGGG